MKRAFWVTMWVVATFSLSQLFEAGRAWRGALSPGFVLETLLWLALLGGTLLMLTLRTYALERRRGKVRRPIAWFERILERGADGE